jgi:ABC-2 type transport system permease protein
VGIFFFTQNTIEYLLEDIKIGSFLLHRFISAILFIFFLTVHIGNIIVSYSTLYKSKEVEYLLTKPVNYHNLFTIKFLDNFLYSSTTLLIIICGVIAGYGVYFGLGIDFYFISILFQIIPFMLTAASLGVIALMLVVRLSVAFGLRKVIAILVITYIASLLIFFKLSNPVLLVTQVMAYYPNINQYFGFFDNFLVKFLPNFWLSESFYWISNNNLTKSLPFALLQIICSLFFVLLAIYLSKKWYFKTLTASGELRLFNNSSKKKKLFFSFNKYSFSKPQTDVLIKKEFWQFFREPSQWVHLCVLLILLGIFSTSISTIDVKLLNAYNPTIKTVLYLVIYLFNIFLIASLSLRFVFPLLSLEGSAYWKIRSSPVNPVKLMTMKFFVFFLIILALGQLINFFSHLNYPSTLALSSSLNTAFITITLVSMNFGMGSIFVNFKEKNPIRIASSQGASITFLFTLLYLVFLVIVLFLPVYEFFHPLRNAAAADKNLFLTSLILAVFAVIVSVISFKIGFKALQRDF